MPLNIVHCLIAWRSKTLQRVNLLTLGSSSLRNLNVCSARISLQIAAGSVCIAPRGVDFNDNLIVYCQACRMVFLLLIHVIWSLDETWWWTVVKSGLCCGTTSLEHALSTWLWLSLGWGLRGCKWSLVLFFHFRTVAHVGCTLTLLSLCLPSVETAQGFFGSGCLEYLEVVLWIIGNKWDGITNLIKPFCMYLHDDSHYQPVWRKIFTCSVVKIVTSVL